MCVQGNEIDIKLTDGRIKSCDACIQPIVQLFNDYGMQTMASCCGHGKQNTSIILCDGREVLILRNFEDTRMVDGLFPPLNPRGREWVWTIKRNLAIFLLRR